MTIYFDNAATTFPKPSGVINSIFYSVKNLGGNAGRGGHILTRKTSEAVFESRQAAADFFGAEVENVIFTSNCTHALNTAIQGIMSQGGHIIISGIEHNSSARPVFAMAQKKRCTFSIAEVSDSDEQTVKNFRSLVKSDTKAIVSVIAGNVTGQILPYKKIGKLCQELGICYIADGAQACGVMDIKMSDGINILCTPGHKGLYGPAGTGLLITDGKYHINPLMQGGTGSSEFNLKQTETLPEALESGTLNTTGIIALKSGIDFVNSKSIDKIFKHENNLCKKFIDGLSDTDTIIYRNSTSNYVPIVSFNIPDTNPEEVAQYLDSKGFCLRAGLHCSPLAHNSLGTTNGTIRFAPSIFNNADQVERLVKAIKKYGKNQKNY